MTHFIRQPRLSVATAVATLIGLTPASLTLAQDSATNLRTADGIVETVVVLGTNRLNVSELSGTAPVDVVSADELLRTGAPSLLQALQIVVPSAHFPQGLGVGGEAWNAKAVSLGGLSPSYTLVLLNGKRINPNATVRTQPGFDKGSQAVDLDQIPVSAIKRVEVLRDGASAQYGSDAIAGVVNIVLRDDTEGVQLSNQTGQYTDGQGFSNTVNGWAATALPGDGFANISFNYTRSEAVSTRVPDLRQYYFPGDPREATVNRDIWGSGKPERDVINVLVNAETRPTENLTLYGYAGYSQKDSLAALIPLRPSDNANVRSIFPDGFQTRTDHRSKNLLAALGSRWGQRDHGQYDLSVTYGENSARRYAIGATNASLGIASPTEFFVGEFANAQTNVDLNYVHDIATGLWAQPLTLSAGVAYRHEQWREFAGDPLGNTHGGVPILDGPNAGQVAPVGYPPGNQPLSASDAGSYSRNVKSLYVSLEQPFSEKISAGLTARTEDYSDFGSTTNAQGSLRYDFTPVFAIRSSIGTGYRAPSLGQMWLSQTTGQAPTGVGIITQGRLLPVSNPIAQLLGASDLKPEKSTSYTLGGVWQFANTSLTVDVYRRDIRDAIVYSGNLSGPYVTGVLNSAGYTDISIATYFTNAVDLRTQGVDVVGQQQWRFFGGEGVLNLSAAASWRDVEIETVRNNAFLEAAGLSIITRAARGDIESAAPRSKIVLGADYRFKGWGTNLNVTRYGSMLFSNIANVANNQRLDAKWITNLDVSYRFNPTVQVQLGVQNLFDVDTEALLPVNRTVSYTPYTSTPTDPFGTFYYGKLTFNF